MISTMIQNLFTFAFSLFLVIKGATLATRYSARLAESFRLSKYVVGFIIVALISILPETFVAINSALEGVPEFGLGTLFGSNIADLSLIFTIITLYAGRSIKIESKILKDIDIYPLFLLLPLLLGIDGHFSRLDGSVLIIVGAIFYYMIFKNSPEDGQTFGRHSRYKSSFQLIFSLFILLVGAHFTVISASDLAFSIGVDPILIALFVVGIGTTMPELFFSIKSVKNESDGMAVGDILGTVLADTTIVVGIIAMISPFYFPIKIIHITGAFMLVASIVLLRFMRSHKSISKREGYILFIFWIIYAVVEFLVNK